ncbi:MAG: prolipoprotein diacylglyceryl transferase [Anaerolineales bacterium]
MDQFGIDFHSLGIQFTVLGFSFTLRYYGMILMSGAVAAAFLTSRLLKSDRKDPDIAWDGLIWVLVFGVIGARLYHIFTPSISTVEQGKDVAYFLTHPLEIINIPGGGLGIPGAIVGGVFGAYLFARRRKLGFGALIDAAAPGLALAQAIGRWGNYVNQELYGRPTTLPWGIRIDPANRLTGYESVERFEPLFLYESILNFINFLVLMWFWRNKRDKLKDGDIFLIYLVLYPLERFLLEFLRLDFVETIPGINTNQLLALLVGIAAGIALYVRSRPSPEKERKRRRSSRRSA